MVSLDEEGGLMVLRYHRPYTVADELDYLAALDDLALRAGPYGLLTIFGGGPALSSAGERAQALWFKRTRERVDAACVACAIVRPNATEAMAATFRRLWSFPILATPDEEEGRRFLAGHLDAARAAPRRAS